MIIKAKPLPLFLIKFCAFFVWLFVRRRFNKMTVVNDIEIKPGHSYILMLNHFSFMDGFFAYYLCFKLIGKKQKINSVYTMSVKRQMEKNRYLRYFGSFSVEPGKRSIAKSLEYAAGLLNEPGNILLYYPQGNLESHHIRHIEFKDGLYEIVTKITGNCQLIWSSVLLEYFESTKPSAWFSILDCGTNHTFDFEALKQNVNAHHLQSMKNKVRFTKEPGNLTY